MQLTHAHLKVNNKLTATVKSGSKWAGRWIYCLGKQNSRPGLLNNGLTTVRLKHARTTDVANDNGCNQRHEMIQTLPQKPRRDRV